MKKFIVIILAGLYSVASFAHNPNVSTAILTEKENNIWVLQISASLTAFQQEIRTHFAETPYKTPEEFQEMVLKHIRNNFEMRCNGAAISLTNGKVLLGHETKVVFEVKAMPSELISVDVKNTIFKDIYKSKSALVMLTEKFSKKSFVFNGDNDYKLSLVINGNEHMEKSVQKASFISSENLIYIFIGLTGFVVLTPFIYRKRKNELK